ncbi:hypothetical protein P8C59_002698 [Phyllachora maydis]|uniref:Pre-mRNA-processing factor 19 n=1 Tax=Phyllachora maydis TaxID=1825666 RepID=A0AAD9M894_9PEZI|nr:hypothetical protein P8C59_002698 [Phyllachora maydis]
MLCGLSGEVPEEPVVSKRTGIVYEKRLLIAYLAAHANHGPPPEPADDELDPETDLLPLRTARTVRPRPPQLTSLPALLQAFQAEWDALVLEAFETRAQLGRAREELATALYQHDAAVRVIARLTRERDEARDALGRLTVTPARGVGEGEGQGEAMQLDGEVLATRWAEHVDEVHQRLTKSRKKRPIPEGWATPDNIAALEIVTQAPVPVSGISCLGLDEDNAAGKDHAVVGGLDGKAAVYSIADDKVEAELDVGAPVTATLHVGGRAIFATAKGSVKIFEAGKEAAAFADHAGAVTGLAVHPGGALVASVGADKGVVLYDLGSKARVARFYTDESLTTTAFHPDGHLLAAGTTAGTIKIFETNTGSEAATFALGAPAVALAFSENGFWFAAAARGAAAVALFDLRKAGEAARVRDLETGGAVDALAWDWTGQFLATAGVAGVTVQQYTKSGKAWSEPLRTGAGGKAVGGLVSVLGAKDMDYFDEEDYDLDGDLLDVAPTESGSGSLGSLSSPPAASLSRHSSSPLPSDSSSLELGLGDFAGLNSLGSHPAVDDFDFDTFLEDAESHSDWDVDDSDWDVENALAEVDEEDEDRLTDEINEIRAQLRETSQQLRRFDEMDVIDLTGDTEGEDNTRPTSNNANLGNPRRRAAIRRTPSLARSHGNLIDLTDDAEDIPRGNRLASGPVIDLGSDDELQEVPPPPGARARARNQPHAPPLLVPAIASAHRGVGELMPNLLQNLHARFGNLMGLRVATAATSYAHAHHHHAGAPEPALAQLNPLGNNFPDLNYGANGYNHAAAAAGRPAFVPPPPAREGFSRDTGEDNIFVCPACEAELKYDPDEESAGVKNARNRRDREEHHFWAVKECGHVFCNMCFANRRHAGGGFRADGRKKVLCAVPDCTADVSAKAAWRRVVTRNGMNTDFFTPAKQAYACRPPVLREGAWITG